MLETKKNIVRIEGILSEIDIKESSFKKDGKDVPSIRGSITVRVDTTVNGEEKVMEIPVHLFSAMYTNKGTLNPAYESIKKVATEFVSIAASDIDHADRIRITKGSLHMNEYYSQRGTLVSFPRVTATFVSKIKKDECKPDAIFTIEFMVGDAGFETDADGVETDRYKIMGLVPQWGGKLDVMPFYAVNKGVIDGVSQCWGKNDTVKAIGKLLFTSTIDTKAVEVDFGEAQTQSFTKSISDLIITGGASTPLEGDFAIDPEDIAPALAERKARLAASKEKAEGSTGKSGKAPGKGSTSFDLGF